jgi:hypothetical protein
MATWFLLIRSQAHLGALGNVEIMELRLRVSQTLSDWPICFVLWMAVIFTFGIAATLPTICLHDTQVILV